jgi:hypothetical protein
MSEEYYNLEGYEEWVDKAFPVNEDWVDELISIASDRESIHDAYVAGRLSSEEAERLKKIDMKWKNQLEHPTIPSFESEWDRHDIPKSHWWFWYDIYNELTEYEKSTI